MLLPGCRIVPLELLFVLVEPLHVTRVLYELMLPQLVGRYVLRDLVIPFCVIEAERTEHHSPGESSETVGNLLAEWQGLDILVFDPDGHVVSQEGDAVEHGLPQDI